MIYFDTSALVKLVFEEAESGALAEWLSARTEVPKITSDLAMIELLRTCRRIDADAVADATTLLGGLDLMPMDRTIVEHAAALAPADLRSLDAIHLASALAVKDDLSVLVAYDDRLCTAAARAGVVVASPR